MKVPLAKPIYDKKTEQEMENALLDAYRNEMWCSGESIHKFEEEFADYIGTKRAVAVSSGTAALQVTLKTYGISGANVITTPNSFIATSNAIDHAGGLPYFIDILEEDGNIDPKKIDEEYLHIENCDTVLPVHIYGNPCNMDAIKNAVEPETTIIEDACQAHGAIYKGKKVGSLADAACFSFYPSKNMTVRGDGGMVTTNHEEVAEEIKSLIDCGRTTKYEHDKIGYTYRMNTINAAIGRVQLKHLDKWNEKRINAAKLYKKLLPEEILLKDQKDSQPVYHMLVIKTNNRDEVIEHLTENEISTGIHYPIPIHLQPAYKWHASPKGFYPKAEEFSEKVLSLPIFPTITDEQVKFVAEKVNEVLE